MKNINKNAMQALASYSESYLLHHNFPAFSLDGSTPFTIEVRFAYQDSSHGSFYSQENGVDIGINDALPYFVHPALGQIAVSNDFKIEKSYCHFLSVVYDCNTLKMYLHGFEVASRTVSKKTVKTSKDFCIGKDFHGFIQCVRVLSRAMSAAEILRDHGEGFQEDSACELWTDFSGIAYKDRSKNALELWRTGHDAHCANVVTCTILNRNGLYIRTNSIDYTNAFSLTGKLYPDLSSKGNFYIYSLSGEKNVYFELYLEEQKTGYYLALDIGGHKLLSEARVQGMRWMDYAVTVDIAKGIVCLYQDGIKCAEQVCTDLQPFLKSNAMIGGKYYKTRPDYGEAFAGLLDYCAEFNTFLSLEKIDAYAQDHPYIYENGITALLLFGWGEPVDICGDMPLGEFGGGYYAMAADTNHITTPVGLNWYVPDNDETYWHSLSEYDQWEISLLYSVYQEVIERLTGIPMNTKKTQVVKTGKTPPSRLMDKKIVQRFPDRSLYRQVHTLRNHSPSPPPSPGQSPVEGMTLYVHGHAMAGAGTGAGMGAGTGIVASFFAGITSFFKNHWRAIIAITSGAAVIGIVSGIIANVITKSEEERPENKKSNLRVQSISWNNQGNPASGSIHFHDSIENLYSPSSMTYTPKNSSINITGVFVPSKLKEINMAVGVQNNGEADYSGCIVFRNPAGDQVSKSAAIVVPKNSRITVEVTISAAEVPETGYEKKTGRYDVYCTAPDEEQFLIRCEYVCFTLLGEPISPWNNMQGNYSSSNWGYVSTPLLNACIKLLPFKTNETASSDGEALIQAIVRGMNDCKKLTYDIAGAPHFSTIMLGFKFLKFTKALEADAPSYLNCADCATIVSALCAQHGTDCPITILGVPYGRTSSSFFYCNQIQAITSNTPTWGYPFDWEGNKGWGGFSFHMVNRSSEPGISGNTKIYDACLKVDGGYYPGLPYPGNNAKDAAQPLGMKAYGNESAFVNVPTTSAFTADIYRERLVLDKAEACFCSALYRVLSIDADETDRISREGKEMKTPSNNLQGKTDVECKRLDAAPLLKNNAYVTEWKLLDDMYDEKEWTFCYLGAPMELCRYEVDETDPKKAVGRVAAQFSNPNVTDISNSYVGSCCYTIAASCYVIWKDGYVYRILGTYAKEVADCIYKL